MKDYALEASAGSSRCTYFAEVESTVVGCAVGAVGEHRLPELSAMWVDRHVRRRGIGRRLVVAYEGWARNEVQSDVVELTVNSTNVEANQFYKALGYDFDGRSFRSKAKPGTDALYMVKSLR